MYIYKMEYYLALKNSNCVCRKMDRTRDHHAKQNKYHIFSHTEFSPLKLTACKTGSSRG
jgi:hypothetical protein